MLYFANPSTPAIRAQMVAGVLGCIATPKQGRAQVPPGAPWCADNGCGPAKDGGPSKGWVSDAYWFEWLQQHAGKDRCLFATAPDVVGDYEATVVRSRPWLEPIRELGYPVALVAQDGMEWSTWDPWDEIDALFIGGSTEWKLGAEVANLAAEASSRGKWVHMGRVNSRKRFLYAHSIGCDSADGTKMAFGPDVHLPSVLGWVHDARDQAPLFT